MQPNGLAIAALALGICAPVCLVLLYVFALWPMCWASIGCAVAAIPLGSIGRDQVSRRNESGASMAWAGTVLAWLTLLVLALLLITGVSHELNAEL